VSRPCILDAKAEILCNNRSRHTCISISAENNEYDKIVVAGFSNLFCNVCYQICIVKSLNHEGNFQLLYKIGSVVVDWSLSPKAAA